VYGRKQVNKQPSMHTHVRNAVTLVWRSLRLAPMRMLVSPCVVLYTWKVGLGSA